MSQTRSEPSVAPLLCWAMSRQPLDWVQSMAWREHMRVVARSSPATITKCSFLQPFTLHSPPPVDEREPWRIESILPSRDRVVSMPRQWRTSMTGKRRVRSSSVTY